MLSKDEPMQRAKRLAKSLWRGLFHLAHEMGGEKHYPAGRQDCKSQSPKTRGNGLRRRKGLKVPSFPLDPRQLLRMEQRAVREGQKMAEDEQSGKIRETLGLLSEKRGKSRGEVDSGQDMGP